MNSPHPSPRRVDPTRVVCYRRSAVEPASQTVSEQAAYLAAWIAEHGIAYEIFLDTDTDTDTDDAGPHPAPTPRDLSAGPLTSPAPVRTPQP